LGEERLGARRGTKGGKTLGPVERKRCEMNCSKGEQPDLLMGGGPREKKKKTPI